MSANCQTSIDGMTEYLEDALPAERRKDLEAHLASCPRCTEFLQALRQTPRIVREASKALLPDAVRQRLEEKLKLRRKG